MISAISLEINNIPINNNEIQMFMKHKGRITDHLRWLSMLMYFGIASLAATSPSRAIRNLHRVETRPECPIVAKDWFQKVPMLIH